MEIIKIIAPWLPVLVVAYIVIENRHAIAILYRIVKRKITGRQAPALRQQPSALEAASPASAGAASAGGVMNHLCQQLLILPALAIFSVCLANEEDEFDDEKNSERFDNRVVNEAFSKLLESSEETQ